MSVNNGASTSMDDDEEAALPGFRFHPTDEELVGFYLRRKVDKKPLSMELIKQVDIYKYDPWDLPKIETSSAEDKEGYFFCKRGRKYRNSIRPNRVTGSGFWKATGIDKPIYSNEGEGRDCIGLKKTLVYYRGSAGKGTKTDWMMNEFRLPTNENDTASLANARSSTPEAEVWTLCRIFKRNVTRRKHTPDWREISTKRQPAICTSSMTCSADSNSRENYLNFSSPTIDRYTDNKPALFSHVNEKKQPYHKDQLSSVAHQPQSMASSSNIISPLYENNQFFSYSDWDELRPMVEFAFDPSHL